MGRRTTICGIHLQWNGFHFPQQDKPGGVYDTHYKPDIPRKILCNLTCMVNWEVSQIHRPRVVTKEVGRQMSRKWGDWNQRIEVKLKSKEEFGGAENKKEYDLEITFANTGL